MDGSKVTYRQASSSVQDVRNSSGSEAVIAARIEQLSTRWATGWIASNNPKQSVDLVVLYQGKKVETDIIIRERPDVSEAGGCASGIGFVVKLRGLEKKSYIELHKNLKVVLKSSNIELNASHANSLLYPCLSDQPRRLRAFSPNINLKFSVIIPIYDRVQPLRESIRSVLRQTYESLEVILVGDNPPQATLSVIREFEADPRVKIFIFPDRSGNACRGRNKGIMIATGDVIAFQDSDDFSFPSRLEVAAFVFKNLNHGTTTLLYSGVNALVDGTRKVEDIEFGQTLNPELLPLDRLKHQNPMFTCTVCVRRDVLLLRGGFRREMTYREDHELWLRLAHHGGVFHAIPEPQALYRIHHGNAELLFLGNDDHWKERMQTEYQREWNASWSA